MRNNNNKGSRSNVNKHELVNCESIILLKKIEKVKDFSFIQKGPYYRDIFNQIQSYPASPPIDACLLLVLLFTIFIIVVAQKLVLQQSKRSSQQSIGKLHNE